MIFYTGKGLREMLKKLDEKTLMKSGYVSEMPFANIQEMNWNGKVQSTLSKAKFIYNDLCCACVGIVCFASDSCLAFVPCKCAWLGALGQDFIYLIIFHFCIPSISKSSE